MGYKNIIHTFYNVFGYSIIFSDNQNQLHYGNKYKRATTVTITLSEGGGAKNYQKNVTKRYTRDMEVMTIW